MTEPAATVPLKRCSGCQELKPVSAFHRRGSGYQWYCRSCRKAWDAAYWVRRRVYRIEKQRNRKRVLREWISELKRQPCVDCGGRFHPAAMTYDHLPGTKKRGNISNLVAGGYRSVLVAEMEKCELVCANCHAVRTYMRRLEGPLKSITESPGSYYLN